jgi:hypothetical protein
MRRVSLILALTALFSLGTSSLGLAAAPLTGEVFLWSGLGANGNFVCATNTHFAYDLFFGDATGPYPGPFYEHGDVTLSGGVVTAWTGYFNIYTDTTHSTILVSGTEQLVPGTGGPAACTALTPVSSETGHASGTLSYTATLPDATTDSGTSVAGIDYTLNFLTESASGLFTQTFGPVVQAGCNTGGNGNGNDSCNQNGNN